MSGSDGVTQPECDILVNVQDPDDEFDYPELSSTYDTQPTEPPTVEAPTPVRNALTFTDAS
jgi:hypothetical protein